MIPRISLRLLVLLLLPVLVVSFVETSWTSSSCRFPRGSLRIAQDDAADKEESTFDNNDDDDDYMAREQRNLRFAGVGRLFSSSVKDKDKETIPPHLQVVDRLAQATVVVVGLGGVGSWAAEALCRSGIGNLVLVDLDDICISNTNRQMHAMTSTIGNLKIDEMAKRLHDINPQCKITLIHDFVSNDNVDEILTSIPNLTACLDAIDGTRGKAALIAACARYQIPIVTCGGSAGRTDPTAFVCDDLSRVLGDPLLSNCRKNLRKFYGFAAGLPASELKKKHIRPPKKWNIPAVISTEPQKALPKGQDASSLRRCDGALGTGVFVTGTSGFVAAGQIVSMIASDKLIIPRNYKDNLPRPSKKAAAPPIFALEQQHMERI